MKNTFKKLISKKLEALPDNKALMSWDLQIAFQNASGEELSDYLPELQEAVDELEKRKQIRVEMLQNNSSFRIVKGLQFDELISNSNNQINISALTAENVQVGNKNIMNIGVSSEEFIEALKAISNDTDKSKTVIGELTDYAKKGVGLAETISKFIALVG